jgi:hypothetical protein
MSKKVQFSARPPSANANPIPPVQDQAAIDAWVSDQKPVEQQSVKRFTVEVPLNLHKRIKMRCAAQDRQMADVLRELLEKHFPEE